MTVNRALTKKFQKITPGFARPGQNNALVVVVEGNSMLCPLLIDFIEDIEIDVLVSELASF